MDDRGQLKYILIGTLAVLAVIVLVIVMVFGVAPSSNPEIDDSESNQFGDGGGNATPTPNPADQDTLQPTPNPPASTPNAPDPTPNQAPAPADTPAPQLEIPDFVLPRGDGLTFLEAEENCTSFEDGHLAVIHSEADNEYVRGLVPSATEAWIGLVSSENEFAWADDSLVNFTNWVPNQPAVEGQCVFISGDTGLWGTANCSETLMPVCIIQNSTVPISESNCDDLQWSDVPDQPEDISCRSTVDCDETTDFHTAVKLCSSATARLCTIHELQTIPAADMITPPAASGQENQNCSQNAATFWSLSQCSNDGFYVTATNVVDGQDEVVCLDVGSTAAVSCCAYFPANDVDVSGAIILYTGNLMLLQGLDNDEFIRELSVLTEEPKKRFQIFGTSTEGEETRVPITVKAADFRHEPTAKRLFWRIRKRIGLGGPQRLNLLLLQPALDVQCITQCGEGECIESQQCSSERTNCNSHPSCMGVSSKIVLEECDVNEETAEACYQKEELQTNGDDFTAFQYLWDCIIACESDAPTEEPTVAAPTEEPGTAPPPQPTVPAPEISEDGGDGQPEEDGGDGGDGEPEEDGGQPEEDGGDGGGQPEEDGGDGQPEENGGYGGGEQPEEDGGDGGEVEETNQIDEMEEDEASAAGEDKQIVPTWAIVAVAVILVLLILLIICLVGSKSSPKRQPAHERQEIQMA